MPLALICRTFGAPEGLRLEKVPRPAVQRNEVRIAVKAASVNLNDALKIEGRHHERPQPPFAPGSGVAGVVLETGVEVQGFTPGDPVLAMTPGAIGGFAEEAVVPLGRVVKIPAGMPFEAAAGFSASYVTAYEALVVVGGLKLGESLLVTGAGGGVGLAGIEIARKLGARVIAVAGDDERLRAAAEAGAEQLIDRRAGDLRSQILALTDGRGVDAALENVGGEVLASVFRCIAYRGRLLVTGFASGQAPMFNPLHMLLKGFDVRGVNMAASVARSPDHFGGLCQPLFAWWESGDLHPRVARSFPLAEGAAAIRYVQAGGVVGKVVLTP